LRGELLQSELKFQMELYFALFYARLLDSQLIKDTFMYCFLLITFNSSLMARC
jgi:hypothetical protein